jgi:putative DNA primase/helicase
MTLALRLPKRVYSLSVHFCLILSFRNYAKLIFSTNELPEVNDLTYAFWRRWIIVDFPNKFEDNPEFYMKNFNEEIIEKLIVIGLIAFRNVIKRGAFTGESNIMDRWLRETNSVYAFIQDMKTNGLNTEINILVKFEDDPNAKAEQNEVYGLYTTYCQMNDLEAKNKREFTIEMERLGYQLVRWETGKGTMKFYKKIKVNRIDTKNKGENKGIENKGIEDIAKELSNL